MTAEDRPAPALPEGSRRGALLVGALAAVLLGALAAEHPDVRFVDAIGFVGRARRLWEGAPITPATAGGVPLLDGGDLVNGLYPIGYPLLLGLGRAVLGDALLAAKVLSVAAGVLLTTAVARSLGAGAGLLVLAAPALATWGATEGTDALAAALTLCAALVAAHAGAGVGRAPSPAGPSVLAGALLGAALLTRYTSVAALPVVLLLAPRRLPLLLALTATTAPHWALALATGASPFPDQSQNLAIAAGHPTALLSGDTLQRWPAGIGHALEAVFALSEARAYAAGSLPSDPLFPGFAPLSRPWLGSVLACTLLPALGALGLLRGALRRDRRAVALLGVAAGHVALVGLAFANERLVLPATLALVTGVGWLLPTRWLALPALALLAATGATEDVHATPLRAGEAEASAAASTLRGPCLTNSVRLGQRRDGWLVPGIQIDGLRVPPPLLDPARLRALATAAESDCVALQLPTARRAFPRLAPLVRAEAGAGEPGYRLVRRADGWAVYAVEPTVEPE